MRNNEYHDIILKESLEYRKASMVDRLELSPYPCFIATSIFTFIFLTLAFILCIVELYYLGEPKAAFCPLPSGNLSIYIDSADSKTIFSFGEEMNNITDNSYLSTRFLSHETYSSWVMEDYKKNDAVALHLYLKSRDNKKLLLSVNNVSPENPCYIRKNIFGNVSMSFDPIRNYLVANFVFLPITICELVFCLSLGCLLSIYIKRCENDNSFR